MGLRHGEEERVMKLKWNQLLFCLDCADLAMPECEHHRTDYAYSGMSDGKLWVVNETGSHGFWSYEPGTNDAGSWGGFSPTPYSGLHRHGVIRPGGGPTYRRYQPVGYGQPVNE